MTTFNYGWWADCRHDGNQYRSANLHPGISSQLMVCQWYWWWFSGRSDDITPEDQGEKSSASPLIGRKIHGRPFQDSTSKHTLKNVSGRYYYGRSSKWCQGKRPVIIEKLLTVGIKDMEVQWAHLPIRSWARRDRENWLLDCLHRRFRCEGLIVCTCHRMAEGRLSGRRLRDDEKEKELLTIAENCRFVFLIPQTFQQALQIVWFVVWYFQVEVCTTCGWKIPIGICGHITKRCCIEKYHPGWKALVNAGMFLSGLQFYGGVRINGTLHPLRVIQCGEILVVGGQTRRMKRCDNDLSYLCGSSKPVKNHSADGGENLGGNMEKEYFEKVAGMMIQAGQANRVSSMMKQRWRGAR